MNNQTVFEAVIGNAIEVVKYNIIRDLEGAYWWFDSNISKMNNRIKAASVVLNQSGNSTGSIHELAYLTERDAITSIKEEFAILDKKIGECKKREMELDRVRNSKALVCIHKSNAEAYNCQPDELITREIAKRNITIANKLCILIIEPDEKTAYRYVYFEDTKEWKPFLSDAYGDIFDIYIQLLQKDVVTVYR